MNTKKGFFYIIVAPIMAILVLFCKEYRSIPNSLENRFVAKLSGIHFSYSPYGHYPYFISFKISLINLKRNNLLLKTNKDVDACGLTSAYMVIAEDTFRMRHFDESYNNIQMGDTIEIHGYFETFYSSIQKDSLFYKYRKSFLDSKILLTHAQFFLKIQNCNLVNNNLQDEEVKIFPDDENLMVIVNREE